MTPSNYLLVHESIENPRIYVVVTRDYGNLILSKHCSGKSDCCCVGCLFFGHSLGNPKHGAKLFYEEYPHSLSSELTAFPLTRKGELYVHSMKHSKYKRYRGQISLEKLDAIFYKPSTLLLIKCESDGTYTHSYLTSDRDEITISKGCIAKNCPCIGCRINDYIFQDASGYSTYLVDRARMRFNPDIQTIICPIEEEAVETITALIFRDPRIKHEFLGDKMFDSPLEQLFYETAFLDLHIHPQYPVGKYRLDFAIPPQKIAIELDGHEYHKTKYQRTHDAKRDRWLISKGWTVLRFTGTEIYQNLEGCIKEIVDIAENN